MSQHGSLPFSLSHSVLFREGFAQAVCICMCVMYELRTNDGERIYYNFLLLMQTRLTQTTLVQPFVIQRSFFFDLLHPVIIGLTTLLFYDTITSRYFFLNILLLLYYVNEINIVDLQRSPLKQMGFSLDFIVFFCSLLDLD